MTIQNNFKYILIILIIFFTPFLEFLKNNINEIDIILGKSFFFLIFILFFILLISALTISYFFRKKDFFKIFLGIILSYWILFKHNFLKLTIKSLFTKFLPILSEYNSEISLLLLIILSVYIFLIILKNNHLFEKFIFIFFFLTFFTFIFQIINSSQQSKTINNNELNYINYPDNLNKKKENIYFFILDAMQPIKEFEKYYKIDLNNFLKYAESKNFKYFNNTLNLYDNTTYSLSAFFYLDKITDDEEKLKNNNKILYPTILRKKNKSDLLNNLINLGYEFKWIGNFFAYCPKFNLKYCLNKDQNTIIDPYLYINFFRQSPAIPIIINLGLIFNFNFDKYFFYKVNNGMGRLTDFLKQGKSINSPTFYFIHHMSPHWPYITNNDCSFKSFPGEKNFDGYKSAYLCTIKKVSETINFLHEFDPNSTIVFQSDHNWTMSRNEEEKKMIFNLIKINESCKFDKNVTMHNVNTLRLIFSCITGNDPDYLNY
jgi:hypothetical protein